MASCILTRSGILLHDEKYVGNFGRAHLIEWRHEKSAHLHRHPTRKYQTNDFCVNVYYFMELDVLGLAESHEQAAWLIYFSVNFEYVDKLNNN